jgi:hypothetical protein
LNGIYLPVQLTNWLIVEVVLLLIGLTKILYTESGFDLLSVKESLLRLRAREKEVYTVRTYTHPLTSYLPSPPGETPIPPPSPKDNEQICSSHFKGWLVYVHTLLDYSVHRVPLYLADAQKQSSRLHVHI